MSPSQRGTNTFCDHSSTLERGDDSEQPSLSTLATKWKHEYDGSKTTNDRINLFFKGLSLIPLVVEEHGKSKRLEKQRHLSSIESSITNALTLLDNVLRLASPGTRSYNKFMGYKSQLENNKRAIATNRYVSEDSLDHINEMCSEIITVSDNLKPLSHSSNGEEDSHISALHDHYTVYKKRKQQSNARQRWSEFIKCRKSTDSATPSHNMDSL